ncbi:MAG: glycosyltransferase family 2 protein, partial [Magnetospirillum sp.]|nr:glycosyltransferase family 2 protein [Magnetospirillum sp.]
MQTELSGTVGPSHCVLIPFLGRFDQVARAAMALLAQAGPATRLVLIDDGSQPPAAQAAPLARILADSRVTLLRHESNLGVAQARNTGLAQARAHGAEIVIMLDSDCIPGPDFLAAHLALHAAHPEAACIGGAIVGRGQGLWAALDRVMSWCHSVPGQSLHAVHHPYHLPTTNMSLKLARLPLRAFDSRLRTGEDA